MASFTTLFNIGKSSILATQYGIETVSRNIANANNPDYTRREITLGDIVIGGNNLIEPIMGVQVTDIKRSCDSLLNNQIYDMRQSKAEWETKEQILEQLEVMLGEDTSLSINESLQEFFNAWEILSQNASGIAERNELLSKTKILTQKMNEISLMLNNFQFEIRGQIDITLEEINLTLEELSTLNFGIKKNSNRPELSSKENLSSLLDERDRLLGELSDLVGTVRWDNNDMTLNIAVGGSSLLIDDILSSLHATFSSDADGQPIVTIKNTNSSNSEAEVRPDLLSGGKLKGLIDAYTEYIPAAKEKIDTLAYNLIVETNKLHEEGYNLYDIEDVSGAISTPFFKTLNEDKIMGAAGLIALSSEIADDPKKIAAALPLDPDADPDPVTNPVHYDDNQNALRIAQLRDKRINDQTFNEYYASELSHIGFEVKRAEDKREYFQSMYDQWWDRKQVMSGVSLDEEYVNLIQYQSTYTASATLISIADEMLKTIIDIVS
ncbi:MAG: flagellar hook-associated protein FlgK [bacterium]